MESAEIARRFLRFFEERGHTVVPSASLIAEDPTLLLVNAGMVPVQAVLPGRSASRRRPRLASAQKCVRTPDIDEVGKTTRHATLLPDARATSPSATTSRSEAIPFAWELLTRPESDGGFGFPEDRLWVTVYLDDDEAARHLARQGRPARRPHPAPRPGGQLLAHGRAGSRRPLLGDLLRPRPRVRPRGRPDRRRGPLPRGLEPRLHAVPAQRGPQQGRLRHRRRAARQEHRHRHGPGAHGGDPAGRRQHLRDRHHLQDPRPGGRAHQDRATAATSAPTSRLRVIADHVRTGTMLVADGVLPGQRGPRLRAAPHPAPRHPQPAPARRRRRALHARADRRRDRGDGRAVPRAQGRRAAASTGSSTPRRRPSSARSAPAPRSSTWRSRRPSARSGATLVGRPGVPAARHLRLPDRPHPGDGGRAGPPGRRGGLPPPDEGAAASGPRPTPRRRRPATPTSRSSGSSWSRRARSSSSATTRSRPTPASIGLLVDGVVGPGRGRGHRRSRSCSTAPPSTPRAAASSPTRA